MSTKTNHCSSRDLFQIIWDKREVSLGKWIRCMLDETGLLLCVREMVLDLRVILQSRNSCSLRTKIDIHN